MKRGHLPNRLITTLAYLLIGFSNLAHAAPVPIVDINPSTQVGNPPGPGQHYGFNEAHGNGMVGWNFTLTQSMTVTSVGWYDDGANGLSRDFQVGLWRDLTGTNFGASSNPTQLLGSSPAGITIPGGTVAPLQGVWRTVSFAPINLVAGSYQLGGLDTAATSDPIKFVDPYPSLAGVAVGQYFYAGLLVQPAGFHFTSNNYFGLSQGLELGPMLFTVPEPGTLALFAFSLAFFRRWRRNHAK